MRRPPPKPPTVRIASDGRPPIDAAAERRREQDRARKARKRAAKVEANNVAPADEAERLRTYESERKRRWRAQRKAAGLPTETPSGQPRHARRGRVSPAIGLL